MKKPARSRLLSVTCSECGKPHNRLGMVCSPKCGTKRRVRRAREQRAAVAEILRKGARK